MTAETVEEVVPDVPDGPPVEPGESSEEAPFGWMKDPVTGERRPRKRPGKRPKAAQPPTGPQPTLEQLQGLGTLSEGTEDVAPGAPRKRRGRTRTTKAAPELPPFRAGVIAKGVNRLYRRAGRVARLLNRDIGTAIIATTKAAKPSEDDEDDQDDHLTVGEAWEALAKTNPRIRMWLLRFIAGGAMSDLFEAHLPILLAVFMVDGIRQRLPLAGLAEAFLTDNDEDEDGTSPLAQMMGGINPQDMAQMMNMAQQFMGQAAANVPRAPSTPYRGPSDILPQPQYEAPQEPGQV
jgi:hypothetical protein